MGVLYVGNGFDISEENGIYYISWEEGVFGRIATYEISKELAQKAMLSDKDAYEVKIYAETGQWPLTEEEKKRKNKNLLKDFLSYCGGLRKAICISNEELESTAYESYMDV